MWVWSLREDCICAMEASPLETKRTLTHSVAEEWVWFPLPVRSRRSLPPCCLNTVWSNPIGRFNVSLSYEMLRW